MRATAFLGGLITAIGQYQTNLSSVRISTNRTPGSFVVRYELGFLDQIYDQRIHRALSSLIRSDLDAIFVKNHPYDSYQKISPSVINESFDEQTNLGNGIAVEIPDDGYRFDINKLKNSLISKTFYGLDSSIRRHIPASKIKIYFGAGNYQPVDINPERTIFIGGVRDGIPYSYLADQSRYIKLFYLNDGVLCEKRVSAESYLNQENRNEIDRFKIKIKSGLQIHTLFMPQDFVADPPLRSWIFLENEINSSVSSEIALFRGQQVERLTSRMNSIHQRKRVSIAGVNLGVEPKNENETVLLFERAFPHLKTLLPDGFFVRLLDYSPRDIDAVCEFTHAATVPSKISLVEFEYDLKSFFDHGHDLRQVNLIICYKMDNINFPYHCSGSSYTLEPHGNIMILRDASNNQAQAYCLILNRYLTVN